MASQKQQYTILYGRLSQEDERAGESNSIQHQRDLLEKYARDKGFENTLFLADDGYSGTNFERPSWKKIVEMIEAGEVSTLIVKDASRLGREYLQVGYYMEIYFPQKNVRFIAVNDGVDSTAGDSSLPGRNRSRAGNPEPLYPGRDGNRGGQRHRRGWKGVLHHHHSRRKRVLSGDRQTENQIGRAHV